MMKRVTIFLIGLLSIASCTDVHEYSPNQIHDNESPRDLNKKNLERLMRSVPDDTLTILFSGDSQQFYDEVDLFVDKVNQIPDVDFVLVAGDISDFGLLQEFKWITSRLDELERPYFGVIGNHDVVANGEAVFKRMFGPLDFAFVYDSVKFLLHNTNGREYRSDNVPDIAWLQNEMAPQNGVTNFVAVSHVPPFSGDFNPSLEDAYAGLFRATKGFLASLHGHIHAHEDGFPYDDGVRYITSYAFQQRSLVVLRIVKDTIHKEILPY